MELAARRYARKVLLVHLALLLLVLAVVATAVKYMYRSARGQALTQAQQTQELLTRQTALGIENYYDSVIYVLNLLQPAENEADAPMPPHRPGVRMNQQERDQRRRALESGPLARILSGISLSIWKNIENRASMLFVVDPQEQMAVIKVIGSSDDSIAATEIVKQAEGWLAGGSVMAGRICLPCRFAGRAGC
jgi:hypothetical protein